MAISVRNLEPVKIGIPTHAPKLWKMVNSDSKDDSPRGRRGRLRFLRISWDPIDELEPLARIWSIE